MSDYEFNEKIKEFLSNNLKIYTDFNKEQNTITTEYWFDDDAFPFWTTEALLDK